MNIIKTILISIGVSIITVYGFYNYFPLKGINDLEQEDLLGTSLTTIQGTDTLSNSRTTINNNFTALNNGKIEVSTSSMAGLTDAENLAVVGTINTGIWNGTEIDVAYGGSGSTSFPVGQLLLGSSTNPFGTIGSGESGQALISQGAGDNPIWQTATVNQNIGYTWGGLHQWTGAAASITNTGTTTLATTSIDSLNVTGSATSTYFGLTNGVGRVATFMATTTGDVATSTFTFPVAYGDPFQVLSTQGNGHLRFASTTALAGWGFGQTSRQNSDGTGAQTIAHGLGRTPVFVRFTTFKEHGGVEVIESIGVATTAANETCQTWAKHDSAENTEQVAGQIICMETNDSTDVGRASLTALDNTNITITWGTAIVDPAAYITWEAW